MIKKGREGRGWWKGWCGILLIGLRVGIGWGG